MGIWNRFGSGFVRKLPTLKQIRVIKEIKHLVILLHTFKFLMKSNLRESRILNLSKYGNHEF